MYAAVSIKSGEIVPLIVTPLNSIA